MPTLPAGFSKTTSLKRGLCQLLAYCVVRLHKKEFQILKKMKKTDPYTEKEIQTDKISCVKMNSKMKRGKNPILASFMEKMLIIQELLIILRVGAAGPPKYSTP